MDLNCFIKSIYNGMPFKKVRTFSRILNVLNDVYTYKIGSNGKYKKVAFIEIEKSIKHLKKNGFIDSRWYEKEFPKEARNKPCNFTSIGGVLQELGYVKYNNGKYTI